MVVSPVSREFSVKSFKGKYLVTFNNRGLDDLNSNPIEDALYIIDKNVAKLYNSKLQRIVNLPRVLLIEATEKNKSIDKFANYIESLLSLDIKRNQTLVAIGGGIIEDITCFLSSILMRGLPWIFYPTTLLAQADSCIGSKSSINSGDIKNILLNYF